MASDKKVTKKAAKKTPKKTRKVRDSIHTWLRSHGFGKVASNIDLIIAKYKRRDVTTRRNWYDVLAYGATIEGIEFKVIPAILARQKKLAKLKEETPKPKKASKAKTPKKPKVKKASKPKTKPAKKASKPKAKKPKVYQEAPKVQGVSEYKGDPSSN
jgi:Holliday junction resolvase-like predicted endonuclease